MDPALKMNADPDLGSTLKDKKISKDKLNVNFYF
jgi:hypothetical protein